MKRETKAQIAKRVKKQWGHSADYIACKMSDFLMEELNEGDLKWSDDDWTMGQEQDALISLVYKALK